MSLRDSNSKKELKFLRLKFQVLAVWRGKKYMWNLSLRDSSSTKQNQKTRFTLPLAPHPTNAPPNSQSSSPNNAPPHPNHKLQTQTQQTHSDWNLQREGENSKRDREQVWRRVLQLTIKRAASLFLSVSLYGGGGKEKCLRKGRILYEILWICGVDFDLGLGLFLI